MAKRAILSLFLIFVGVALASTIDKDNDLAHLKQAHLRKLELEQSTQQKRSCPNACSGNGDCINNVCECDFGWSGSDCSLYEVAVSSGQVYYDTVNTYQWKYYYISVPYNGQNLVILLNETNTGDCDLYAQLNALPTRSNYYYRDISTNTYTNVNLNSITSGTWYFGVYGFTTCSYNIQVNLFGVCPNNCFGNGACVGGECRCYTGYAGPDCSYYVNSLIIGSTSYGSADYHEWVYYQVDYESGNQLAFYLTQTSQTGDCDMYLKYEEVPTLTSWDYANVTTRSTSALVVTDAQYGNWFLGIYGYTACSFSIIAQSISNCPNMCSLRGTCSQNSCICPSGYSGDYCQTRNAPLTNGDTDNGYVQTNNWNYYTYVTGSTSNFVINVTELNSGSGDCDLYVKAGSNPTRFSYDYFDLGTQDSFSLTINDPGYQTWYIGVYGWSTCTYSIMTFETSSCPNNCNGHGTCLSDGSCQCGYQYTGEACEYSLLPMGNNYPYFGSVTANSWNYYSFSVSSTSSLNIVLKETYTTGSIYIYVAKSFPTLSTYLYSDTNPSNNIHAVAVDLEDQETAVYQIGVYGTSNLINGQGYYTIIAYAPDF